MKLAYSTSVDQLKKQGVNKVNVLGVDRIAMLIQEAVKKSLRFRLLALDREEVASATKEEFLRLLKSNEDLEKQHDELKSLKDQAEAQIDELRLELSKQQSRLEEKLASAASAERFEGEDRDIAERITQLIRGLTESGKTEEVPSRVLEFVMSIVGDERRATREAREAVRDKEVAVLQRRIEKLSASLEQTEHRLSEVTAIKHLDQGISSVYRKVQGLDLEDRAYEAKTALMSSIFEANVRLQGK
jgi:prefoldin subunit 5